MKVRELLYQVPIEDEGKNIRQIVKEQFGLVDHDISRAKYRQDGICLNGQRVFVNTQVACGDQVRIRIEDQPNGRIVPTPGPLTILYEDDDLIAVDKPAGIVVHPSHGHYRDSLGNYIAAYYEAKGEPHDIRTIGRLDMETSGVILYGKTRSAVYLLNQQHEKGLYGKTYLALFSGNISTPSGRFDGPIGRVPEVKLKRMVRPDGDEAHTFYEILENGPTCGLARVKITTGRTHQIRVHFANDGHPLLGDLLYGDAENDVDSLTAAHSALAGQEGIRRAALHCHEVHFRKPFTGEEIHLRSALPEDMAAYISKEMLEKIDQPSEYKFWDGK
ncbi:MAG: RluA family pseudouridine synthase [Lachnospiraceae bacterium]|nr:RluA family pseudouridine synthase [Candidatus Equihabitans merdae]